MSHIVSIETQIRDREAVELACNRLQWPVPEIGSHKLFSKIVEGLGVRAPNWIYPIVCHLDSGHLSYDNYNGHWGDPVHLDRLKQAYAVEKTKLEARRQGRTVTENSLSDGSVQLVVEVHSGQNSASDSQSWHGGAL